MWEAVAGTVMSMFWRRTPVQADAFEETGIRVLTLFAPRDVTGEEEVWLALGLLREMDPRRFHRVVSHIRVVVLTSAVRAGTWHYVRTNKICLMNLESMRAEESELECVAGIAGFLVHQATYGRYNRKRIPVWWRNIERIRQGCVAEQDRFLSKFR